MTNNKGQGQVIGPRWLILHFTVLICFEDTFSLGKIRVNTQSNFNGSHLFRTVVLDMGTSSY